MSGIEAGKRCAAIVWQRVIIFFLLAGAFNVFVNWNDTDALAGSLAGLAVLLATFCACAFAYGFMTSAAPATATVETPLPTTEPVEEKASTSKISDADDIPWWAWLGVGLMFLLWKSDFSITAMPGTAMMYLRAAFSGLNKLLGLA